MSVPSMTTTPATGLLRALPGQLAPVLEALDAEDARLVDRRTAIAAHRSTVAALLAIAQPASPFLPPTGFVDDALTPGQVECVRLGGVP